MRSLDDRELLIGFAMVCGAIIALAMVVGAAVRIFRLVAGL